MILKRNDADHPWIYDRCREVYKKPDNCLDLWSRGHYKSTIITFAKTIQDILKTYGEGTDPRENPLTFGLFSHTRPIAVDFAIQIRLEFEQNEMLRFLFPDICWKNPQREAPKWSNHAFTLRGAGNRKEATVEAWGLVDSMPTSKHFDVCVYDDVITQKAVATPDQIRKATEAWRMSINLRATNGVSRYIGTKYAIHDTYKEIEKSGSVFVRRHPATFNGELEGEPVFWPVEIYKDKVRKMGAVVAACQLMQDPKAALEIGFKRKNLRFYLNSPDLSNGGWNTYILVDPAKTRRKRSDWTAIGVIALGADKNYYVIELIRDKISLKQRAEILIALHRQYQPNRVGYEEYGMQSDIDFIMEIQERENYRFEITALAGHKLTKNQRIEKLGPLLDENRIWFPQQQIRRLYDGRQIDVVKTFLEEEYDNWPVTGQHEDVLDMLSRITDPDMHIAMPKSMWSMDPSMFARKSSEERYDWIH